MILLLPLTCLSALSKGKTKTITELTRSLLECSSYNIIVMSERYGAVDAIAEKFASVSLMKDDKGVVKEIIDVPMWFNVLCFGSAGMGGFTKMFTREEKLR